MYLYNQSPGGTGSRGIACVAVTFGESCIVDCIRPSSEIYMKPFDTEDFSARVQTEAITNGKSG